MFVTSPMLQMKIFKTGIAFIFTLTLQNCRDVLNESFRIAWNEFILALVLTDRATCTVPVAASRYVTDVGADRGRIMALGSLIAIPPLILTFIAARRIISGLTAGAVNV